MNEGLKNMCHRFHLFLSNLVNSVGHMSADTFSLPYDVSSLNGIFYVQLCMWVTCEYARGCYHWRWSDILRRLLRWMQGMVFEDRFDWWSLICLQWIRFDFSLQSPQTGVVQIYHWNSWEKMTGEPQKHLLLLTLKILLEIKEENELKWQKRQGESTFHFCFLFCN